MALDFRSDPAAELVYFVDVLGVDGVFADHPATARAALGGAPGKSGPTDEFSEQSATSSFDWLPRAVMVNAAAAALGVGGGLLVSLLLHKQAAAGRGRKRALGGSQGGRAAAGEAAAPAAAAAASSPRSPVVRARGQARGAHAGII